MTVDLEASFHDEVVLLGYGQHEETPTERKRARQAKHRAAREAMELEKRKAAAIKAMSDPAYVAKSQELSSNDQIGAYQYMLNAMQNTPSTRFAGKQAALGAAYGQGVPLGWGTLELTQEQRRWANAFKSVLGVSWLFYTQATPERKTWLENHYTELAQHDTRKGRKAAQVVRHRVEAALDDANKEPFKFNTTDSVTGRMTLPSLQNIPKSGAAAKIFGKSFDAMIIDELGDFQIIDFKTEKP